MSFSWNILATILLIIVQLFLTPYPGVVGQLQQQQPLSLKSCYLAFGEIADLGYTYSHNVGRRLSAMLLRNEGYLIDTAYYPNAFMGNHTEILEYFIRTLQCDLIIATAPEFSVAVHKYVRLYRNITFALESCFEEENKDNEPNLIVYGTRSYEPWYVAGVAAALATNRSAQCINYIAAYDTVAEVVAQTDAFVLGAQRVMPNVTVNVVVLRNWYSPDAEQMAVSWLDKLTDCNVFAHYSDPTTVNSYVASLRDPHVFSVGIHSNTIDFAGDSVLTSVFSDWTHVFENITRQVLNAKVDYLMNRSSAGGVAGGTLWMNMQSGATSLPEISPLASIEISTAVRRVHDEIVQGRFKVFCDQELVDINGAVRWSAQQGCLSDNDIRNMTFYVKGIKVHRTPFRMPQEVCSDGQRYRYDLVGPEKVFDVVCEDCPANTYSLSGPLISTECTPCKDGYLSDVKASFCYPPRLSSALLEMGALIGIIVGVVVFFACIIAVIVWHHRQQIVRKTRDVTHAPTGNHVVLVFTDVQNSSGLWQHYPEAMRDSMSLHHDAIRRVIAEHKAYEVKTIGDSFMIACSSCETAVQMSCDIQRALMLVAWPSAILDSPDACVLFENRRRSESARKTPKHANQAPRLLMKGLRVRIGMDCGSPEVVYDSVAKGYDFYGDTPNTAARVESAAHGGQILITKRVHDHMTKKPSSSSSSALPTWTVTNIGPIVLKGITQPVHVFQVLPSELPREFAAPREHNSLPGGLNERRTSSTSSGGNAAGGVGGGGSPHLTFVSAIQSTLDDSSRSPFQVSPEEMSMMELVREVHRWRSKEIHNVMVAEEL